MLNNISLQTEVLIDSNGFIYQIKPDWEMRFEYKKVSLVNK